MFQQVYPNQTHNAFWTLLHIKAIAFPLIKGYVLGVCMQGLFIHCMCDVQGYGVIAEHGNTSSGKRQWVGSFMRNWKSGYMGADNSEQNERRVKTKKERDCYTLWLNHVSVVCTTAQLFKWFPWFFCRCVNEPIIVIFCDKHRLLKAPGTAITVW